MSGGDSGIHTHVIETERCGAVNVYVQGDIEAARKGDKESRPVFLTVHDIAKNHNSWVNFVYHPSMANVRERATFVHVDIFGQEDDAEDFTDATKFPSLEEIGEDLINVLDNLRIKYVIALGDGAGANLMVRFAAMHGPRCLGVVLINPTASPAKFMDKFKEKLSNRLKDTQTATENYLLVHKFGQELDEEEKKNEEVVKAFEEYKERLRAAKLNFKNAKFYVDSFMKREDITPKVKAIDVDMMLVAGAKSPYVLAMEHMFTFTNKTKTSILKIDDTADVLEEAPGKLANSLLLFCKGLGWLTSLATAGYDRQRSMSQSSTGSGSGAGGRRMSMEDYDRPNIRRLSLTGGNATPSDD